MVRATDPRSAPGNGGKWVTTICQSFNTHWNFSNTNMEWRSPGCIRLLEFLGLRLLDPVDVKPKGTKPELSQGRMQDLMLQVAPQPTTSAQHNWSVNNDPWCIFYCDISWSIIHIHTLCFMGVKLTPLLTAWDQKTFWQLLTSSTHRGSGGQPAALPLPNGDEPPFASHIWNRILPNSSKTFKK